MPNDRDADSESDHALTVPLSVRPIGVVRSPFVDRVEAPRQPRVAEGVQGRVVLFRGRGFEDALLDLALWDHLWLVVWFHKNADYRPKVSPPRSAQKRGVLSTRAPYRPNPIGLSAVRLLRVEGLELFVAGVDLLDHTPVLDIKPYVPYTDAIPEANHGWLEMEAAAHTPLACARPADPVAAYQVRYDALASAQLGFLEASHGVALAPRIDAALRLGPSPHAYRRIRRDGSGYRLSVKDWRVFFSAQARIITVHELKSGYRASQLFGGEEAALVAHRAFVARWPRGFS